jgi:hypothetical protein
MPLVARDDSLLTVIDLQPRFWAERLEAEDKRCAEEAARRAAWLAAAAHALGIPGRNHGGRPGDKWADR